MSISIVAIFTSKMNKETELELLLKSVIDLTRKEEGCSKYTLYVDKQNPKRFTFLEEWRSKADLDKHLVSDHIKNLFSQVDALTESSDIIQLVQIK